METAKTTINSINENGKLVETIIIVITQNSILIVSYKSLIKFNPSSSNIDLHSTVEYWMKYFYDKNFRNESTTIFVQNKIQG